jgi:hypothetical protein
LDENNCLGKRVAFAAINDVVPGYVSVEVKYEVSDAWLVLVVAGGSPTYRAGYARAISEISEFFPDELATPLRPG